MSGASLATSPGEADGDEHVGGAVDVRSTGARASRRERGHDGGRAGSGVIVGNGCVMRPKVIRGPVALEHDRHEPETVSSTMVGSCSGAASTNALRARMPRNGTAR